MCKRSHNLGECSVFGLRLHMQDIHGCAHKTMDDTEEIDGEGGRKNHFIHRCVV